MKKLKNGKDEDNGEKIRSGVELVIDWIWKLFYMCGSKGVLLLLYKSNRGRNEWKI